MRLEREAFIATIFQQKSFYIFLWDHMFLFRGKIYTAAAGLIVQTLSAEKYCPRKYATFEIVHFHTRKYATFEIVHFHTWKYATFEIVHFHTRK